MVPRHRVRMRAGKSGSDTPRPSPSPRTCLPSPRAGSRSSRRNATAVPSGCCTRPLAEQSRGEFTLALPATRTRDAPFPEDAKPPEIRHRSYFRLQPLQSATTPLLTGPFQDQTRRRDRPVAPTRGGLILCHRWKTRTCDFPLTVPLFSIVNGYPKMFSLRVNTSLSPRRAESAELALILALQNCVH